MEIGKKLKDRRKELGLTMYKVAQMVGVSEATVSRWESGDIANMRRDKIALLANALHVSPIFIMDWNSTKDNENNPETFTDEEKQIINNYRTLNTSGKEKAAEYITDLSENPKYTASENKINTHIELVADSTECTIVSVDIDKAEIID